MFRERRRTTDSHPVRSMAIFERRQVQNDSLPFAELDARDFASTLTSTASLCTLTANKHLIGIRVQQLKGSTRRSTRRFYVHRERDFTRPGGKGIEIFNFLAVQLPLISLDVNGVGWSRSIADHLGRESVVVYPPCDTETFTWQGQQGYYLSTARLTPLKRVDRIVEAFLRMPDKKLVVASQGEEFDRLKLLAGDAKNITFLGWVSEADLRRLIGEAIATIYVPVNEDFGMSPVESMAAGKPCIGVAEGGLLETVLDGETGLLLRPDFTVDDLVEAVHRLNTGRAMSMRHACEARATLFRRRAFVQTMHEIIGVSR